MKRRALIEIIKRNFECMRCNNCCKQPGFVYLTVEDSERIAEHFKLPLEQFVEQYCKMEDDDLVLKVNPDESCIYLTDKGCSINEVKPVQCQEFPFKWRDKDCFDYCEGIKKVVSQKELHTPPKKVDTKEYTEFWRKNTK